MITSTDMFASDVACYAQAQATAQRSPYTAITTVLSLGARSFETALQT